MKKHIPNTITLGNVLSGCLGIVFAFEQNFEAVGLCVLFALLFDFLDGFVARLLKVTFGVLPSIVMYQFMKMSLCDPDVCTGLVSKSYFPYLAFITAAFSALRLAMFNNDTRQTDSFIGLPTPANAAFIISIPLISVWYPEWNELLMNPKLLGVISIGTSYLLVAELPLLALKFKSFRVRGNEFRYLLILTSGILLVTLQVVAVPIIIVVYILFSLINNIGAKKQ